jgi:CysZ protein
VNLGKRGTLVGALLRAVPVFFSARLFALVLLPLVAAAVAWIVVAWLTWEPLVRWLSQTLFAWSERFGPVAAGVLAAVMLMFAAVLTALVAIAVLAMPVIVEAVAARDFTELERRRGGTFAGSLFNALRAVAAFVPLWLLALPLLVFPPAYIVANILLNAWLNRRLLPYDALALHADPDELQTVIHSARGRLFRLGLVIAPLSLVPFVNLFASLFAGIAFTYLCLDELAALRAQPVASRIAEGKRGLRP